MRIPLRSIAKILLVLAASLLVLCVPSARGSAAGGVTVQNRGESPPQLVFACDRPADELQSLFTPQLIADLKSIGAGVALSTGDLSPQLTAAVERLNAAGIPVTASLVLPGDEGYYSNAGNAPQTLAQFLAFDRWTRENHLKWDAIGLDIEPNLSEFGELRDHKIRLIELALRRAFDKGRVTRARTAYASIIPEMQARGYSVDTYQFPLIADERDAHSSFLERLLGIVDVRGNKEVLMLYTSFNEKLDSAMIWEYGPEAQAIAVGVTASSGDPATDAAFPPLNWDQFSRDLIVARHFSTVIGVYNLSGCIKQGFIARLKNMDWNQPVVIPSQSLAGAVRLRRLAHAGLWLASNAIYIAAAFLILIGWLIFAFVRRRRRKRAALRPAALVSH